MSNSVKMRSSCDSGTGGGGSGPSKRGSPVRSSADAAPAVDVADGMDRVGSGGCCGGGGGGGRGGVLAIVRLTTAALKS